MSSYEEVDVKRRIFNEMVEFVIVTNREIKNTIKDDEYILWLIDFLEINGWCNNEDGIECLSLDKIDNLERLKYFKDAVLRYASKNYIYSKPDGGCSCFFIEYNGRVYSLKWFERIGKDVCYFDKLSDTEVLTNIIKFEDLIENKKLEEAYHIEDMLDSFEKNIENQLYRWICWMNESGVPSQAAGETVQNVLKRIIRKVDRNR